MGKDCFVLHEESVFLKGNSIFQLSFVYNGIIDEVEKLRRASWRKTIEMFGAFFLDIARRLSSLSKIIRFQIFERYFSKKRHDF